MQGCADACVSVWRRACPYSGMRVWRYACGCARSTPLGPVVWIGDRRWPRAARGSVPASRMSGGLGWWRAAVPSTWSTAFPMPAFAVDAILPLSPSLLGNRGTICNLSKQAVAQGSDSCFGSGVSGGLSPVDFACCLQTAEVHTTRESCVNRKE